MNIRVTQIWGFILTAAGWIFIACSLAMEGWKVATVGGQGGSSVIYITWYWSSLWRTCSTTSNGVFNCYDFPVLWSVENNLQVVRALLMGGLAIGMLGFILCIVGMECTYIGGSEKEKNRAVFTGSLCHIISGVLAAAGYAVYAFQISAEFFNPSFDLKSDLGTPLYLGWAGCIFQVTGGLFYLISLCKIWSLKKRAFIEALAAEEALQLNSTPTSLSSDSEISSKSKVSTVSELSIKSSPTMSSVSHKSHYLYKV